VALSRADMEAAVRIVTASGGAQRQDYRALRLHPRPSLLTRRQIRPVLHCQMGVCRVAESMVYPAKLPLDRELYFTALLKSNLQALHRNAPPPPPAPIPSSAVYVLITVVADRPQSHDCV
jgi:hypothetical protein